MRVAVVVVEAVESISLYRAFVGVDWIMVQAGIL